MGLLSHKALFLGRPQSGDVKTRLYGEHHLTTLYFCLACALVALKERVNGKTSKNTPIYKAKKNAYSCRHL
ncbi:hypothetical protein ACILDU_11325 [Capnocytophaga canimorsus]|uniref:hypothetical protein n=1 Tax=Capnocytophaga canimorsus TaxID=28188 RepID=UPI0037D72503